MYRLIPYSLHGAYSMRKKRVQIYTLFLKQQLSLAKKTFTK